ncbi:hypothetical protein NEE14_001740 [Parabacteroides sp. AD58]|uniref:Uncharacterized protein n=1 Tax=Parabacteroides absconsus TaxID=2951805 RepID=A0ABZ2IL32_9BACT|nr:hypothetical protein [Parabacteroides sp. AD58]MCM6902460.1 hypothetical protein [Parabacteroides sp. AD58]
MILSHYFIRKKILSILAQPATRQPKGLSLPEAEHILLVYTYPDKEEVEACLAQVKGKHQWTHLLFSEVPVPETALTSDTIVCTKKELDAKGFPPEALVEKVKSVKADLLIDLTTDVCYPLLYLVAQHTAGMKAGVKKPFGEFYDFSLALNSREKISYVWQQIVFYLQTFRTK